MNRFFETSDPISTIHQMIGCASMCWENPSGAGVFDEAEALKIFEEGINRLREQGVVFPK